MNNTPPLPMVPSPLLSLCIPTYNRADVLDVTLAVLFSLSDFDPTLVEVVVSDNCSTDHTAQVVAKYPLVRYFRNEENVRDTNFSLALLRSAGAYAKLMNDTVHLCPGGLELMLEAIRENLAAQPIIFFCQRGHRREKHCRTVGEFAAFMSFRMTWIGNFGVWRRDLPLVEDASASKTQLLQVDWSYRLAASRPVTVYCAHYCDVAPVPATSRDPYNVFQVFIENFLSFSRRYLATGEISRWQYEVNKYKLFNGYIRSRAVGMIFRSRDITHFDNSRCWRMILGYYAAYPYFYLGMLWEIFRTLSKKLQK